MGGRCTVCRIGGNSWFLDKDIYDDGVVYRIRAECTMRIDKPDDPLDEEYLTEVLLNWLAETVNDVPEDSVLFNLVETDHRSANEEGQEKGNEDVRES